LVKCRSILEKAVDAGLLEPFQSPAFTTLRFKFAFPVLLFEFGFPLNTPLIAGTTHTIVIESERPGGLYEEQIILAFV
jgi:hypothetical protein